MKALDNVSKVATSDTTPLKASDVSALCEGGNQDACLAYGLLAVPLQHLHYEFFSLGHWTDDQPCRLLVPKYLTCCQQLMNLHPAPHVRWHALTGPRWRARPA
jgi:hypothetical protein